jgi:hypothetical protein
MWSEKTGFRNGLGGASAACRLAAGIPAQAKASPTTRDTNRTFNGLFMTEEFLR